ncbi:MAG: aspartyl/asparaginyl beta-hydroxylase domain-containing protein [Rhodanobacter sp.]
MAAADTPGDDLVAQARGLVIGQRMEDAEVAYREALDHSPDNPEALNFIAMCELGRGEFDAACAHLEHAIHIDSQEASFRKNLGIAQLALGRAQEAIDTFDEVIAMDPKEFSARLHRAAALERLGNSYDATTAYYRAIAIAQAAYLWRNRQTTPASLQPLLQHAIGYIKQNQKRIFMEWMQPAREQYGAASVARIEAGLSIYLKEGATQYVDERQHCSFFYVPGLAASPFLDATKVPGMDDLARQGATFMAELRLAEAAGRDLEPYFATHDLAILREQGVLDGGEDARLEALYFYRDGDLEPLGRQGCPQTFAAVKSLPHPVEIERLGPNVYFVVLGPDTHVLPSQGLSNARIHVEIPLWVSEPTVRQVADTETAWQVGEPVAYDASFVHELWNHGDESAAALVLDAWHPDLSAAERMALTALFEGISQFHVAAGVEPPFGN